MIATMAIMAVFLTFLGFPMWLILAIISLVSLVFFIGLPLSIIAQTMFGSLNEFVLVAIPLFILAGHLIGHGSIATRLINLCKSLLGNTPGGIAVTTVGVNEMFGAISGSAPATTATLGKILFPTLTSEGYNQRFSAGLLASMGALSTIVPPSINMILFAATAQVSVAQLFLAGVVPSILIAAIIALFCVWYATRHVPAPRVLVDENGKLLSFLNAPLRRIRVIATEFRRSLLALGVPVIIFGGIYSGFATPTEVAALACVYSLAISVLIYKEIDMAGFVEALTQAARVTAQILIIMAAAGLFAWVLAIGRVPQGIVELVHGTSLPWWTVLLLINLMLLVVGMFMDPVSAIVILTPLLMPVAKSIGVDPIHFGMIVVVNLGIGMFTPPFGLNLFVVMSVCKVPFAVVLRGLMPFLGLYFIALALVSFVPMISLWLPTLVYR